MFVFEPQFLLTNQKLPFFLSLWKNKVHALLNNRFRLHTVFRSGLFAVGKLFELLATFVEVDLLYFCPMFVFLIF